MHWLFNCIGNCFSGIWLTKIGQHVVDVGIFEAYIPFDLQLKQTYILYMGETEAVTAGLLPLLRKNVSFPIM